MEVEVTSLWVEVVVEAASVAVGVGPVLLLLCVEVEAVSVGVGIGAAPAFSMEVASSILMVEVDTLKLAVEVDEVILWVEVEAAESLVVEVGTVLGGSVGVGVEVSVGAPEEVVEELVGAPPELFWIVNSGLKLPESPNTARLK